MDKGWTDVQALQGGFDAWQQKGYPVEQKVQAQRAA
jgi:3-mercaptopyruvate sulfurtransferase SseA